MPMYFFYLFAIMPMLVVFPFNFNVSVQFLIILRRGVLSLNYGEYRIHQQKEKTYSFLFNCF